MIRWIKYLLICFMVVCVFAPKWDLAQAAQTATTTKGFVDPNDAASAGWTRYIQHVFTSNAAAESACGDVRGYEVCTAKVDISGTINVDLDWNLTGTYDANFVVSESDDIAADTLLNPAVDGLYLCYDMDACTACTLTLTIYCVGSGTD
jgi:hypothetical protein